MTTVLTELVPQRAASLVALNSLGRNLFAALGGAVAPPLASAIGYGWLFTMLAFMALINIGMVGAFRWRGRKWRENIDNSIGVSRVAGSQFTNMAT